MKKKNMMEVLMLKSVDPSKNFALLEKLCFSNCREKGYSTMKSHVGNETSGALELAIWVVTFWLFLSKFDPVQFQSLKSLLT